MASKNNKPYLMITWPWMTSVANLSANEIVNPVTCSYNDRMKSLWRWHHAWLCLLCLNDTVKWLLLYSGGVLTRGINAAYLISHGGFSWVKSKQIKEVSLLVGGTQFNNQHSQQLNNQRERGGWVLIATKLSSLEPIVCQGLLACLDM